MKSERHALVKQIFLELCDLTPVDRRTALERRCGDDPSLRVEVQTLLDRHDALDSAERTQTAPTPLDRGEEAVIPEVDGFRVLRRLGEGGMGEVWEAEQLVPVRRRCALKLLKRGMDSKEILGRFEAERQALALMNHPCVAAIFDAGMARDDRPYFAMELVQGEPITDYCDRHRLTLAQRIDLFLGVCSGVQHAHQKGLIHRDLKPSNVLVSVEQNEVRPKIIDFGIAKATSTHLDERSYVTQLGQWIGTPEYMSPEQAEMSSLDVDTRTDVYSLGVLLYELLAGSRPFDSESLRSLGFDEMRRRIREDEPTRPSVKVARTEDSGRPRRSGVPGASALAQQLRGDLDWITMRALEKDRTRRYGSPGELAEDLRRHLRHEPVVAGPPSARYRMGKFVRRHRVPVVATLLVLTALVVGLVVSVAALGRAREETQRAREYADFLASYFDEFNPYVNEFVESKEELLDRALERLQQELAGQPLAQARLRHRIGAAYRYIDRFGRAESTLLTALEGLEEWGGGPLERASTLNELGLVSYEAGRYAEAVQHHRRSLDLRRGELGERSRDAAVSEIDLALATWTLGDAAEAERLLLHAEEVLMEIYGADHAEVAQPLFILGVVYNNTGALRQARDVLERSLEIRRRTMGPNHVQAGWTARTLARSQYLLGDLDAAETTARGALQVMQSSLGEGHSDVAYGFETLGTALRRQGRFEEALPLLEQSLERRRQVLGPDHAELELSHVKLARLHLDADRPDLARTHAERSVEIARSTRVEGHPQLARNLHTLAAVLARQGEVEEALALQEEALAIVRRAFSELSAPLHAVEGVGPLAAAPHLVLRGSLRRRLGELDRAEGDLERAIVLFEAQLGSGHPDLADALVERSLVAVEAGRIAEQRSLLDRALAIYSRSLPATDRRVVRARRLRGGYAISDPGEGRDPSVQLR